MPRYDSIGQGYADTRREDPDVARAVRMAIGDAQSVVNVGAGTGSYEPAGLHVIAIEPSATMAAQRAPCRGPAIRATAGSLPLHDRSVDAAMTVLSLHHWDGEQAEGLREMQRVARGPVVIVTCETSVFARMWLVADYFPEVAELDREIFPTMPQLREWLDGEVTVSALPISRDSPDWSLAAFWAHPERVLDEKARRATSGFARMPAKVVDRVVRHVERDLESGAWDARHGHLRKVAQLDVGLRLVVARRPSEPTRRRA